MEIYLEPRVRYCKNVGFPSNSVVWVAQSIKALRHNLRHHHRKCKMQDKLFQKHSRFFSFGNIRCGAFLIWREEEGGKTSA